MQPVRESCRTWDDEKWNRCGAKAVVLVWGKLFDPEDLGPKCIDHLPEAVLPYWPHRLDQIAVLDLRELFRTPRRRTAPST